MKVLFKNYDLTDKKQIPFYNDIQDLSANDLKAIIEGLPLNHKDFPISIITEKFVITKVSDNHIEVRPNDVRRRLSSKIEIDNFEKIFEDKDYIKKKLDSYCLDGMPHEFIFAFVPCIIPVINLLTLFFNHSIFMGDLILFFLILVTLSIGAIYYCFMIFFQRVKKPAYIIEPTIPYLNEIKRNDISLVLVLFSQLLYPIIFENYSIFLLEPYNDINRNIMINFFCYLMYSVPNFKSIYKNYKLKQKLLEHLITRVRDETEFTRNFYLNIYIDIKKSSILKSGLIPKIITIITIALTIVPFYSLR